MNSPEAVDLRSITGRQLEPLLLEETVEWDRELDWDFRRSAELVRQYADARGLQGVALLSHGEVAGYSYAVLEDHKGLVGDLYLRPPWRNPESEAWLLGMMMRTLAGTGQIRRIESQLMLLGVETGKLLERQHTVRLHERVLMTMELSRRERAGMGSSVVPDGFPFGPYRIEAWGDHHYEAASAIITQAYRGHVDSDINDQYRSQPGAHRFLYNIVQYPGCGNFYRAASHLAFDRASGAPAGVVLSSLVGPETGHITQLCIAPAGAGQGARPRTAVARHLRAARVRHEAGEPDGYHRQRDGAGALPAERLPRSAKVSGLRLGSVRGIRVTPEPGGPGVYPPQTPAHENRVAFCAIPPHDGPRPGHMPGALPCLANTSLSGDPLLYGTSVRRDPLPRTSQATNR